MDAYERQQLTEELREWKRQSDARLGYRQRYLTRYKLQEVHQWKTTTMRETVNLLVKAADNYRTSLLDPTQRRVTNFFHPINDLNNN